MKITELVTPLFLFAAALRRRIHRRLPLDFGEVKREALSLFSRLEAEAASKSLTDRWNRAKIPLVYLIDEIAIMDTWPGSEMWNDQSLEIEVLGHTEKMRGVWFYDQEYAHAVEHGDAELMEILYTCMCLGFEGKYRGQTAQLRNQMDNLFARLPLPFKESTEKLFPNAYQVDLTANDPRMPMRVATAAAIFVGILLAYIIISNTLYGRFVGQLNEFVAGLPGT